MSTVVPAWRRLASGGSGLFGAVAFIQSLSRADWWIGAMPSGFLFVAALAIHRPTLPAQLLARAVWWSNFALGVLISVIGNSRERGWGLGIAAGCGVALLVCGSKGVAEASERGGYAPAAFRSSLMLLMVLTLADAQTFGLFGIAEWSNAQALSAVSSIGASLAMFVAFGFLVRLSPIGIVISGITAAFYGVMNIAGFGLGEKRWLGNFVAALCAIQIAIGVPVLLGLLGKVRLPSLSAKGRGLAAVAVIFVLLVVSILGAAGAFTLG